MKLKNDDILQLGDVIHFNGCADETREIKIQQGEPGSIVGEKAGSYLCLKHIKKITRKSSATSKIIGGKRKKERDLGPDEIMQAGDMIRRMDNGTNILVAKGGGYDGSMAKSVIGYGAEYNVFRQVKSDRISRREYKQRVRSALVLMNGTWSIKDLRDILEGKK